MKFLQPSHLSADADPDHAGVLHVRETAEAFQRELQHGDIGAGATQRRSEFVQLFVPDLAEELKREMELFRLDPAHGRPGKSGLELLLNRFEPGDQFRFQRDCDERSEALWRGRVHGQ